MGGRPSGSWRMPLCIPLEKKGARGVGHGVPFLASANACSECSPPGLASRNELREAFRGPHGAGVQAGPGNGQHPEKPLDSVWHSGYKYMGVITPV